MREHRRPSVAEATQHGSCLAHVDQPAVEAAFVAEFDEFIRERQDPVHGLTVHLDQRDLVAVWVERLRLAPRVADGLDGLSPDTSG